MVNPLIVAKTLNHMIPVCTLLVFVTSVLRTSMAVRVLGKAALGTLTTLAWLLQPPHKFWDIVSQPLGYDIWWMTLLGGYFLHPGAAVDTFPWLFQMGPPPVPSPILVPEEPPCVCLAVTPPAPWWETPLTAVATYGLGTLTTPLLRTKTSSSWVSLVFQPLQALLGLGATYLSGWVWNQAQGVLGVLFPDRVELTLPDPQLRI